ncbi:MAG: HAD family hydrolase [Alphaproteobacteria bacterium]
MDRITLPKAVFWDWDGTLVDSFAFLHSAHNHVRGKFDTPPFTLAEFSNYFGQPREKLYTEIYGVERIEEAKAHFEDYVYANHHQIKVIEGAHDVLKAFLKRDIPMGVVTNKKGELVAKEIGNHGWQDYFISVVGAGEAEADKPSAAPLHLALGRSGLGVVPQDTWFVGDTISDLACAQSAGAPCVFILNDEPAPDYLKDHKPLLIFKNHAEFLDFLLQCDTDGIKRTA